jgi:6-phosphogluconolactonase (cycloisomerase 2 family)
VLIANFASGSVSVLPVARRRLACRKRAASSSTPGTSVDPGRQKGPHAHAVAIDRATSFVFVPDLGWTR